MVPGSKGGGIGGLDGGTLRREARDALLYIGAMAKHVL